MPLLPPKELQEYWYQRLAEEGFVDIEDTSNEKRLLKSWHSFRFASKSQTDIRAKIEYSEMASEVLHGHQFKNESYRRIWELHCEGLSIREIEEKFPRFKKSWIHEVIAEIRREMKDGLSRNRNQKLRQDV